MLPSDRTSIENDAFTVQAADPAELEQLEGGLVIWIGPDELHFRPNPNGDGFSIR